MNVEITNKMLLYTNQSRSNYQRCLQRNYQKVSAHEQKAKERKRAAEAVKVLEPKQVQ